MLVGGASGKTSTRVIYVSSNALGSFSPLFPHSAHEYCLPARPPVWMPACLDARPPALTPTRACLRACVHACMPPNTRQVQMALQRGDLVHGIGESRARMEAWIEEKAGRGEEERRGEGRGRDGGALRWWPPPPPLPLPTNSPPGCLRGFNAVAHWLGRRARWQCFSDDFNANRRYGLLFVMLFVCLPVCQPIYQPAGKPARPRATRQPAIR